MNAPRKIGNAISEYSITKKDYIAGIPDKKSSYDKMSIFLICLDENRESQNELISMLNTLLSSKKSIKDKKRELEENFKICMTKKMEKEIRDVISKMAKKGFSALQIGEVLERPLEFVEMVLSEVDM